MADQLTVDQLLQVAAACYLLEPLKSIMARVAADIPGIQPRHPLDVLREDGIDTAASLGRLTEFWCRLTGRTCFMADLCSLPKIVGKRFEAEADRIVAGVYYSEEDLELRRYGLLWSYGLEGEMKVNAAAALARELEAFPC